MSNAVKVAYVKNNDVLKKDQERQKIEEEIKLKLKLYSGMPSVVTFFKYGICYYWYELQKPSLSIYCRYILYILNIYTTFYKTYLTHTTVGDQGLNDQSIHVSFREVDHLVLYNELFDSCKSTLGQKKKPPSTVTRPH